MRFIPVTRDAVAHDMGLMTRSDTVSAFGVAELLRSAISRWGLTPRRALIAFAREQLASVGLAETMSAVQVGDILARLETLGECVPAFIDGVRYIAPGSPRWVETGRGKGVLLSVHEAPTGIAFETVDVEQDVLRRMSALTEAEVEILQVAGIAKYTVDDWLRPLAYSRHARRRSGSLVRHDQHSLKDFWELLMVELAENGLTLGADAEVRAVGGFPGSYFGRHNVDVMEGRWQSDIEDGVWCAYRRGYSDAHWHPALVAVDGPRRRVLDLFDADEWRWALLAKGVSIGPKERVRLDGGAIYSSFPLPAQISTVLDLLGPRTKWSWQVDGDIPPSLGSLFDTEGA